MSARMLLAVLAASLAGAVVIPIDRPGLGWAIAGVALLALARKGFGVLWMTLAAALLALGAFRSAGWVFAFCVITALALIAVTVVNGQTWRELGLALPRWGWGVWRAVPSVAAASDRHGAVRMARGVGVGLVLVIIFGLLLGSAEQEFADLLRPLLSWTRVVAFVGVALLCLGAIYLRQSQKSAQAQGAAAGQEEAGREETGSERAAKQETAGLERAEAQEESRRAEAAQGAAGLDRAAQEEARQGAAARQEEAGRAETGLERAAKQETARQGEAAQETTGQETTAQETTGERAPRRLEWARLEWAIPVALVDLLFAAFAVVQFPVLFGGHEHVLDPLGPTYAEYVHGGFLNLTAVVVLTLAVVAIVLSRVAAGDRLLARVLVGLLCALTLVIVRSALWRMQLYVEAFGFTRTRLAATALIIWIGLIFVLVILAWGWVILPRLTLAAGAAVLLGLAILNPDRIIAQTVIDRWEKDGHLDAPYLAGLSPDALPALDALPNPKRSCIAGAIIDNHLGRPNDNGFKDKDAWNEWNAARAAGRAAGATTLALEGEDCGFYLAGGYRLEGNWVDPSQLTGR